MSYKWVYLFEELDQAEKKVGPGSWDRVKGLLGGKGANLAEMTRIGLPVPPGFTVTTEACNAYQKAGEKFPDGMWEQELAAMKKVESKDREEVRRPEQSSPRFLPFRRQVLDARHDGYRAQPRPE